MIYSAHSAVLCISVDSYGKLLLALEHVGLKDIMIVLQQKVNQIITNVQILQPQKVSMKSG